MAIQYGGPGYRNESPSTSSYRIPSIERCYLILTGAMCVDSSLLRACYLLCGAEMGELVLRYIQNMTTRAVVNKLEDFSHVIHECPSNFDMRRLTEEKK